MRLAVSPDGLVDADSYQSGSVERDYEFDHTVGVASVPAGNGAIAPTDTTPDDKRSLSFETDVLDAPLELTGTGRVTVRLESTAGSHRCAARLVDDGAGVHTGRGGQLKRVVHPYTHTAGLVKYRVAEGDAIEAGQVVADVRTPHGERKSTVVSEYPGYVLSRHEGAAVFEGDPLLDLAVPDDDSLLVRTS